MISIVPILAILTTAAELRQAVWSGVHEGERFSIECTVTAAMDKDNPDHSAYSIMDASGATYVKSTGKLLIEPGVHVKMLGHIGIDEYNWQHAFIDSAEILSKGDAPEPMPITAAQLSDVSMDSRLVSMSGIVSDIVTDEIDPRWKFVLFRSDSGPFVAAAVSAKKEPLERLVGAKVLATGVANVLPYVGRRRFMIPQLLVQSENGFSVAAPAPADPFSAPKMRDDAKIENLRHQSVAAVASMGLRRVDGRVLAVAAGRHGKARNIKIAGSLDNDGIRLSVADDGCGFDPAARPGPSEGHFGLQGAMERLSAIGGTMRIEGSRQAASRRAIREARRRKPR